jgi:uncharacterized membrane protein
VTARWETALLAVCLAVVGLVTLALVYAGPGTYEDIATHEGFAQTVFRERDGSSRSMGLSELVGMHNGWIRYVTGRGDPPGGTTLSDFFTRDEIAHMTDVRRVFIDFEIAATIASAGVVLLLARGARRSAVAGATLARDAAIAAGIGVAAVAIAASVAFDPLFLLFHEVFFPQGNFLFGPDSNLIAMYPDAYWYGVTLRIGVAFVAVTAITAIGATATLRRARR